MGTYFSKDKNIQAMVESLLKEGWTASKGKHWIIYTPDRRLKVTIPTTPSCPRAYQNFRGDIRRLQRSIVQQ